MTEDVNTKYIREFYEQFVDNTYKIYLLTCSLFMSLMHVGFACLVTGTSHTRNTADLIMKHFLAIFICGFAYYFMGHAFAFGHGSPYIGFTKWLNIGLQDYELTMWYFYFAIALNVSSIICASIAERCHFVGYMIINVILSGISYPINTHWAWHKDGFLRIVGFFDLGGCGPIHVFAGATAFIASVSIGPRKGRFVGRTYVSIPYHSRAFIGIGCLLRLTGQIVYSSSIRNEIDKFASSYIPDSFTNHILGGTGALILATILGYFWLYKTFFPFEFIMYNTLTGLVACSAAGPLIDGWKAIVTGLLGSITFCGVRYLLLYLQVDDPLDVTATHFGGGAVGLLTAPFFLPLIVSKNYFLDIMRTLGKNVFGLLVIVLWSLITGWILFRILGFFKLLRVSDEIEEIGLDRGYHNAVAYPPATWEWGKGRKTLTA